MLIICIEPNADSFHSTEEQPWRTEVWQDGYARVPEEWRETVMACRGYCDLEIGEEECEVVILEPQDGEDGENVTEPRTQPVVTKVIPKTPPPAPEPDPDNITAEEALQILLGGSNNV